MSLNSSIVRSFSIQLMSNYPDVLSLFDRINLAACAVKRAKANVTNNERFYSEYETARMWHRNNCYIRTTYTSYKDN
jgi:hypothetical protein